MKKTLFLPTLFFLLHSSCTLLLPFYGVRKSAYESFDFQKQYLLKTGVDTFNIYRIRCNYLDSLSTLPYAVNLYKTDHNGKASAVQFRLYDKNGNLITAWEQCFGNAKLLHYFDSIPMKPHIIEPVLNKNLTLEHDLNLFDITDNEREKIIRKSKGYDYTVIIFWAAWAGSFTKKNFRNVYRYMKKDSLHSYFTLKLNVSPCPSR